MISPVLSVSWVCIYALVLQLPKAVAGTPKFSHIYDWPTYIDDVWPPKGGTCIIEVHIVMISVGIMGREGSGYRNWSFPNLAILAVSQCDGKTAQVSIVHWTQRKLLHSLSLLI